MLLLLRSLCVLLAVLLVPSTIVAQVTFNQIALTGESAPGVATAEFSAFTDPTLSASGDVAFQVELTLDPQPVFGGPDAIYSTTAGAGSPLEVIALTGEAAPGAGGAGYDLLFPPSINASGNVTFTAFLQSGLGDPVSFINNNALFGPVAGAGSPLGLIAREDSPVPGAADGAEFAVFGPSSINMFGDVAFMAFLRTGTGAPVGASNDVVISGPTSGSGSALGVIARTGDPALGVAGAEYDLLFPPAINASGDVALRVGLRSGTGAVVNSSNNDSIFGPTSGAGSSLGLIVREDTPAPGVADGAEFASFVSPALNASGDVAFQAFLRTGTGAPVDLSNDDALFGPVSGAGSSLGLIVREDTPAPGLADGAEFDFFGAPAINATGNMAFEAFLRTGTGAAVDGSNNRGLFTFTAGQMECIVREGDQLTVTLPGGSGTETRTVLGIELSRTGLNDSGMLAFRIIFTDGSQGIFTTDAGAVLLGDVDRSGVVDFLDISPFIVILSTGGFQAEADIDQNGVVNFLDISPFILILAGS